MKVGLAKMNKQLLHKLKMLTDATIVAVNATTEAEIVEHKQLNLGVRRGNRAAARAKNKQSLMNQMEDLFS